MRPNSSYARYWHGCLVLLKPLLTFFNAKQIRLIFQTTVLVLLGVVSMVLARRFRNLGFVVAIMLLIAYGAFCGMDAAATLPMFFSLALALCGAI